MVLKFILIMWRRICDLLLILSVVSISNAAISQENALKKIKNQQEDFKIFKTTLMECHAGLYNYNDTSEIVDLFNELEGQLTSQVFSQIELFGLYTGFITKLNCIHSVVGYKKIRELNPGVYNFSKLFYFCNGELRVTENYSFTNFNLFKGDVVHKINGESVNELVDLLFCFIPSDGNNTSYKLEKMKYKFFVFYALFHKPLDNQVDLQVIHQSDTVQKTIYYNEVILKKQKVKAPKKVKRDIFEIEQSKKLSILTLPVPLEKTKSFNKKLNSCFSEISENQIQHLIIDLRNNPGGKTQKELLEYLIDQRIMVCKRTYMPLHDATYKNYFMKKFSFQYLISNLVGRTVMFPNETILSPKSHFNGQIYVLINGRTASAASNLASILKEWTNAIIIGQESGGGYKSCNSGGTFLKLPNSQLLIPIRSAKFENNVLVSYENDGVTPDYLIPDQCGEDSKVDVEMEFVLQLITNYKQ